MNKKSLALVSFLSVTHPPAVADFYIGGKLGLNTLHSSCHAQEACEVSDLAAGMHIGYTFNELISVEYGQDYLGSSPSNFLGKFTNDDIWALTLAPKFNISVTHSFDFFSKLGSAYLMKGHDKRIVPTASLGFEYEFNDVWTFRTEYQRYQNLKQKKTEQDMDSDFLSIGFSYNFNMKSSSKVASSNTELQPVIARPVSDFSVNNLPNQKVIMKFNFDSSQIEDAYLLEYIVKLMHSYPDAHVEITGHSDSTGPVSYNKTLAEQRAQAVAKYLKEHGVAVERMTTIGVGESSPISSNKTPESRAANRRVEVVIPKIKPDFNKV